MSREPIEKYISRDKSKKKQYYVYKYFGKDPKNNKTQYKYKSFSTLAEARKARNIHLGEMAKRALPIPSDDTVEAYMKHWIETFAKTHLEESTRYGYKNIINKHLLPYFGNKKFQELSTKDINEYYSYMSKHSNLSKNTIHKHHDLLNNICRHAIRENILTTNPVTNVTVPKVKKNEPKVYTIEEMQALLEKAEGHRLEIVIALAAYLGLRRGEICGLKWNNIDFGSKIAKIDETAIQVGKDIIIKEPKTARSRRDVTLADDLIEILNNEKEKQDEYKKTYSKSYNNSDLVVCWNDGRAYRPNYISELFTKFIKKNNLKNISLHNLRHTFVSIAIAQGENIVEVSRMVGHSKVSTTMDIYAHLLNKNSPKVTNAVANAIRRK